MSDKFRVVGTGEQCPCKELVDLKIEIGSLLDKIARLEHKVETACAIIEHFRREENESNK